MEASVGKISGLPRLSISTVQALIHLLTLPISVPVTINGITGVVSSVQREDGSGRSFNVVLNTGDGPKTTYLRCAA
jgi:hypothetical protein